MDKQELIRRLMRTFLGELEGHLQAFDRDLMALETASDSPARAETINALFRTAHSLKGSSRAMNIEILEAAAHCLETIFGEARDSAMVFSPDSFQLMFRVVDGIKAVKAQLDAQKEVERTPLAALLTELQASFDDPQNATPTPSPTPLPEAVARELVTADAAPRPSGQQEGAAQAPAAREPAPSPFLRERSRDIFVRVSSVKLDRMVALGGELLVARRRTDRRKAELELLLEKVRKLDAGWRAAKRTLRDVELAGRKAVSGRARLDNAQRTMAAEYERLQSLLWQLSEFSAGMQADLRALDQVAEPLEDEIMKARMLPFSAVCDGLGRALRDVAHETGKESVLVIEGGDLEINRSIAEAVKDPLLHLIRNAVDHGIESPATRIAAGKPARGKVTVSAMPRNGGIEIAVADDGGGFDLAAIRAQAQKRGLAVPEDDVEAAQLVFAPGFSTTSDVTVISGRGVGLDLVKNAVEAKRGRVEVQSIAGAGTRFTITMPFSLSMLPLLLVEAGGQTYGFDCSSVIGLRRIGIDAIHAVGGRDTILFEDVPVPLVSLADSLDAATHEPAQVGGKVPVVILASGNDRAAFVVEELVAEQVVMVKDLGPRLRSVRGVNGATILPTGRIALVLNAADLVAMTRSRVPSRAMSQALDVAPAETRKRLLVVDDSITTRTLVQSILEATGFDVTAAVDGMEAWRMLQERGADLVVSDIEMPRMDGFALTEAIRTSRRFRDLPVILVTALESDEDRMRGLDAGADAYLRKSSFDQSQLIDTIRQLL